VTPDARPVVAGQGIAGQAIAAVLAVAVLAVLVLVAACTGRPAQPQQATTQPAVPSHPATPSRSPAPARTADLGSAGTYQVGQRRMTFVEPAHTGPTGQYLGQRMLLTVVWYPLARGPRGSSGSQPARGPFPLLMFAPGFMQCGSTYSDLLRAWASAGYVVAVVNFPRTDCVVGAAAYEPDLVNQPGDMSYVLGRLLTLSAQPRNLLSGLLNRHEIAAAGQSDGGDTVAALAADTCCADHRLKGVAVLSGAEWPPMPGPYFARGGLGTTGALGTPPMLFVQGTADTINPPWASVQLYRSDAARARYYLDLFGADHMIPYTGTNPVEHLVARVTLAFFDRYVLGHAGALATMTREANVSGAAALFSGGRLPP
jgi:dienelactone hydrolase